MSASQPTGAFAETARTLFGQETLEECRESQNSFVQPELHRSPAACLAIGTGFAQLDEGSAFGMCDVAGDSSGLADEYSV